MNTKKLVTTAMLVGLSMSLVACQSVEKTTDSTDEKVVDNKTDKKKVNGNLTETEYVDQLMKLSDDLIFGLEVLSNNIPDETIVDNEQADKVIKQAEEIIPIVEKLSDLKAPEPYEAVQEKYKEGSKELKALIEGFIDEWKSLVLIDVESLTLHLNNGILLLAEAEMELYKVYGTNTLANEVEGEISTLMAPANVEDLSKDETKTASSKSSYTKEELKGTWESYDEVNDIYTNVNFGDYGYASKYVGNADGSSTTWSGSWHLDGDVVAIDVEEAYKGFDQDLAEFEKELRFDLVSKTDKKLVVKHKNEQITFNFLY